MTEKIILEHAGGHIETQYSRFQSEKRAAGSTVSQVFKVAQMKISEKFIMNTLPVTGNNVRRSTTLSLHTPIQKIQIHWILVFFTDAFQIRNLKMFRVYRRMPYTVWPYQVNVSVPRDRLRCFGNVGAAVSDGLRRAGGFGRLRLYSDTFIFRIWLSPRFYIAVSTSRINRIRDVYVNVGITTVYIYRNYDFLLSGL